MRYRVQVNVFYDVGQIIIAVDFPSLEIADEQVTHSPLLFVECLRVRTKQVRKLLAYILTCRVARTRGNIDLVLNFHGKMNMIWDQAIRIGISNGRYKMFVPA